MKSRSWMATGLVALALQALAVTTCSADLLYDVGASASGGGFGNKGNWGFQFSVTTPITVSALGMWDDQSNGLVAAHGVGLWETNSTFQGSVLVDNSSYVVSSVNSGGRWLFTNLAAPVTLHVGTYTLAFNNPSGGDNFYNGMSPSFMTGTSYITAEGAANAGSLAEPRTNSGANGGWVGPNLLTAATPEPSTFILGGTAAVGLLLFARRRATR